MSKTVRVAAVLLVFVVIVFGWYRWYLNSHHLSFVPRELGVTSVDYSEEKSWGFGPGGNETGFLAYTMPPQVAEKIERDGLKFFQGLRSDYWNWSSTPVVRNNNWGREQPLTISGYLGHYGFMIEVDRNLEAEAATALNQPGNFYAYARGGRMIVVVPQSRRVFVVYAG